MIVFLLYLLESTLCLSVLFGVYLLFFRKETFFAFNRIYLLGSMLFSLIVPVVHVSVSGNRIESIETSVREIQNIKSYYSRIIALTDPEFNFRNSQSSYSNAFEEYPGQGPVAAQNTNTPFSTGGNYSNDEITSVSQNSDRYFSWIRFIRWVYLAGIALFFFRLVGLLFWLMKIIRNNSCIRQGRFKIVQLQEEIPPFSFFRYVFVNKDVYIKTDFEKILAHEITHIRQLHSFDLVLAHSLSILQWFNPLVWQLQKAIKTNHEYLADKQVVDQGHELFDYQSLLLTELISIRSVELVNNFNLLSIKKRIAMMTQKKSGFTAKLKVLLIVPFAIVLFLLFADMTFYGQGKSFSNFISLQTENEISKYQGIWQNIDSSTYGKLIAFDGNSVSVLEDELTLKEYKATMNSSVLSLDMGWGELVDIRYGYKGNMLRIWWSEGQSSEYKKTTEKNSLNYAIGPIANTIELPVIEKYRIVDWPEYFNIVYSGDKLTVGAQHGTLDIVDKMIKKQKTSINKLSMNRMTVKLYIDKTVQMKDLEKILNALRENSLLKVVYMAHPSDQKESVLFAHCIGRVRKLPPLDAEILPREEVKKKGITLIPIDVTDKNNTPDQLRTQVKSEISTSEKYITPVEYEGNTLYGTLSNYDDMVFSVVYELRDEYASEKYGTNYDELSEENQKEVRAKYPLTIFLWNKDEVKKK